MFAAPPGFAFYLRTRVGIWTEFNDVRMPHSTPLASRVFVAIKFSSNAAADKNILVDSIGVDRVLLDPTGVRVSHDVSLVVNSVVWTQGRLPPRISRVLLAMAHSHFEGTADAFLFQGTAHGVFHDVAAMLPAKNKILYGRDTHERTLQSIRARQKLPGAARLACSYVRDMRTEDVPVGNTTRTFPRASTCKSIDVFELDVVVVSLHQKRFASAPDVMPMHTSWFIWYEEETEGVWLRKDRMLPLSTYVEFARYNHNWTLHPETMFLTPPERVA